VFVVDPALGNLHLRASLTKDAIRHREEHEIDIQGSGILASVARRRCVHCCPDVLNDAMYEPTVDRPPLVAMKAMLAYPLIAKDECQQDDSATPGQEGRLFAVLLLCNTNTGKPFEGKDVANLKSMLDPCGCILSFRELLRLERRRVEQLSVLLNIASVDVNEIQLSFLSDRAVGVARAQRGTIFVVDEKTHELYFMVDTDDGKKEVRMPLTRTSLAGAAILNNELINIPDCYEDARFNPAMDKKTGFRTKQMLCCPIVATDGKPIGAIQVINTDHGRPFCNEDAATLQRLRLYVQICILNQKAAETTRHVSRLSEQAMSVSTSLSWCQTPSELVAFYFSKLCVATDADYISLTLPMARGGGAERVLRYDNQNVLPYGVPVQPGSGTFLAGHHNQVLNVLITGQARNGKLLYQSSSSQNVKRWYKYEPSAREASFRCEQQAEDVGELPTDKEPWSLNEHADYDSEDYARKDWKNLAMLPIPTRQGTYVLTVAGKKTNQCFSILDEELLVLTGQPLCEALSQFELSNQLHSPCLSGLLEIMATDVSAISVGLLRAQAAKLCHAAQATIFVVDGAPDEDLQHQELHFSIDLAGGNSQKEMVLPLTADSIVGQAILNNIDVNIPNCYADDRFDPAIDRETGIRSTTLLCVPITASCGQPIGALQVINHENGLAFTHAEAELLKALRVCFQIAIRNEQKPAGPLS